MHSGIKIAICGKGGVGKTTVCAVWAQLFAQDGLDVLAIDADPDTNLALAFGLASDQSPQALIEIKQLINERLGVSPDSVSAYFRLNPKVSDLPDKYCLDVNGLKLLVLGAPKAAGGGCACAEGAFLKAMLTHIILDRQEVIVVDLAAGVEFMGRASVRGIDALAVVVEPGKRSIASAVNIGRMARQMGIKHIAAIANKITEPEQIEVIKAGLEDMVILASLPYSSAVQEADLKATAVFDADAELGEKLRQAKDKLTNLILSGVETNPADTGRLEI